MTQAAAAPTRAMVRHSTFVIRHKSFVIFP